MRSAGCHQLIKDGAALVENEWDVLQALSAEVERVSDELGMAESEPQESPEAPKRVAQLPRQEPPVALSGLSEEEKQVYSALPSDPIRRAAAPRWELLPG